MRYKYVACARLSDSIVGTYWTSKAKIRRARLGVRGGGKNDAAPSLPSPRAFSYFWTTFHFHHHLGAWNRLINMRIMNMVKQGKLYEEIRWTQEPAVHQDSRSILVSLAPDIIPWGSRYTREYNNDIQLFPIMRTCRIRRLFGCPRSTARG